MARKQCSAILFITLLICGIMAESVLSTDREDRRDKRFAPAIPVVYYGAVVTAAVFASLVATYGMNQVRRAGVRIRNDNRSHNCANNRGWCRRTCFGYEYVDWYHSAVCGGWKCCRPR